MSKQFITEFPKESFTETTALLLVGKEGYPVEIVDADLATIQILNSGIYIGVVYERLEGSGAYLIHTRGPIRKAIAGYAISAPAYVKMTATGLEAASSADKACGIAIAPKTIAAGDIVSFMAFDCIMP
ncbi:MAG TPA: hypothetical protein VIK53_04825 [Verrucomicrobiae bacterium]